MYKRVLNLYFGSLLPLNKWTLKTNILLAFLATFLLTNCRQNDVSDTSQIKKGLTKVTILYPNTEGNTFDMDYYANKHMPMVAELLGDALKGLEIDKGMAGRTPEDPVPYLAIGYLYFDSLAEYQNAFGPNAAQITGDIPNYTNSQPVIQISEVVQ